MTTDYRFPSWFAHNWSRSGLVLAIALLALAPLLYSSAGLVVFLTYLWLPFYMLHQYEEHANGTFLEYYRRMMPGIAPFLTERKLLVVNIGAVWLLFLIALYAAHFREFWLALYAPYVSLFNVLMHLGQTLRWRTYNPGLWSAVLLFLPYGILTLFAFSAAGATKADNLWGLSFGVLAYAFFFALGRGWIARTL